MKKKSKKQLDAEINRALRARSGATKKSVDSAVEDALEAFWASIAASYPQAKHGDLSPSATASLKRAASAAISEWIDSNVPSATKPDYTRGIFKDDPYAGPMSKKGDW